MNFHSKKAAGLKSTGQAVSGWEKYFRHIKDSSILWSLEKGYLNFNGAPIYLHSINRQSLLFFKMAISKNLSSVLVYPSTKLTITSLLALESLYFRLHEQRLPSGRDCLIIFSSRVELRREIKDNFIGLRASTMPLYSEAFPIGRITSEGNAVKISKSLGNLKLLISPGPSALPNSTISNKIFGGIIESTSELTEDQMTDLLRWAEESEVPFIFIISPDPPTKPAIALIDKGFPYWGWDPISLAEDCSNDDETIAAGNFNFDTPFSRNIDEIRNKATGLKRVIVPVKESKLNSQLIELRKNYLELSRSADSIGSPAAKDIAKKYLGCIYALEEMTAPIAFVELELNKRWGVVPVKKRIGHLIRLCEAIRSENQLYASFAIRSANKILETYAYMEDKKSGKHPVILQIIKEARSLGKSVLFVSKNEALNEALKFYLEVEKGFNITDLHKQKIDFIAASRINRDSLNTHIVDTCVLYGCPRYYQRDILSYAKSGRIGIIAYESEIPAIKYIHDEIEDLHKYFSNSVKVKIAERISGIKPKIKELQKVSKEDQGKTDLIFIDPQDAEMGEYTPEDLLSSFLSLDFSIDFDYSTEAEARSAERCMKGDSDYVHAVKVSLLGGRYIMLHAEKHVQIYDESTEKVKDRIGRNLKRNDLLILIENSTRKSLAESIINKVESHPSMIQVVVYQKAWSYYLRQALEESGDHFNEVIEKLTAHGAKEPKTPAAVYQWINGVIIGPSDLDNIRRIGEIYNKPFLIDHFKEIANAVRRLRSIHRSLAKRLNRMIPRAGIQADQGQSENTVIDEKLDLYLEDFANVVSMGRIESIELIENASARMLDKVISN